VSQIELSVFLEGGSRENFDALDDSSSGAFIASASTPTTALSEGDAIEPGSRYIINGNDNVFGTAGTGGVAAGTDVTFVLRNGDGGVLESEVGVPETLSSNSRIILE
jgi:hypothetical protein